jgi:hypothetical protein
MQNLKISPQEAKRELARRELARRHFKHFAPYIYDGYQKSWHTELICEALDYLHRGEIRFLFIEAPPRHSKSVHVSQLFPAYVVGKDKDNSVIVASYSGDLATDHGRETRNLIETQAYQNVFDTRLAPDSTAKGKWNTNGKGAYNAAGVGGSLTGKGAEFFIIDDPLKDRKEADSQLIRDERWKWFTSVARTRLSPNGRMCVMHTRWHQNDIIGRLTEGEGKEKWITFEEFKKNGLGDAKWVRLTLKAIAEVDEEHRKAGEALWPQRYSIEELTDIKNTLGPYEFSALYQQHPVDDANREFKDKWFKTRQYSELEKMNLRKFATIDTALKKSEGSDYTGVTRNYVNELNEWHFRAERYRLDGRGIIDLIFTLHEEGFEKIGVEEGAFSFVIEPFLREEMQKRNSFPNVVPLKHNNTMKEVRIRGLIPRYSFGKVYHLQGMCTDLESEMLVFPKGANDDVLDSAAYQLQIAEPPGGKRITIMRKIETRGV